MGTGDAFTAVNPPRAARLAVTTIFFVNGAMLTNWFSRLPAVRDDLDLSEGQLGVALLGTAVGALLAQTLTGVLLPRLGSRRIVIATALGFSAAMPALGLVGSLPALMATLVVFGGLNGALDVAMNAEGVAVEEAYGRPIFIAFHGLWSVGGLTGALVGAEAAGRGLDRLPHFLAVAAVGGAAFAVACRSLLPTVPTPAGGGAAFARPSRALLGLAVVAFCVVMSEGAVADWSTIYLGDEVGAGARAAGWGLAAFSLLMALGRLTGDRLNARFGPVALVRLGGVAAALGMGLALAAPGVGVALVGFGLIGAGLSVVFPLALSAAGRTTAMPAGRALAAVATSGYVGFMIGPPVIGFGAEAVGLRGSLGVVVLLGLAATALAGTVGHGLPARNAAGVGSAAREEPASIVGA